MLFLGDDSSSPFFVPVIKAEHMQIILSEEARREMENYFEGQERTPIRIYLMPGGCHGARLGLAMDTPDENDVTCEVDGFTFCLTSHLEEMIGGASIELTQFGFLVTPEKPLPYQGGGCGSCCGGCGSGSCESGTD